MSIPSFTADQCIGQTLYRYRSTAGVSLPSASVAAPQSIDEDPDNLDTGTEDDGEVTASASAADDQDEVSDTQD